MEGRRIGGAVACEKNGRVFLEIRVCLARLRRFWLLINDERTPAAVYAELVKDRGTLEVLGILALGAELEGLVEQLCCAVEHLADDGQPLVGVGLEDGGRRERFTDQ